MEFPSSGLIKINWDAALNKSTGCIGFGCVARDWMRKFLGAKCTFQWIMVEPKMAEVMSALHAINFGIARGWFDIVFEGDALQVFHDHYMTPPHLHHTGHFVEGIQQVLGLLSSSTFVHCHREENRVAHALAKKVVVGCFDAVWCEDPPPLICNLINREHIFPWTLHIRLFFC